MASIDTINRSPPADQVADASHDETAERPRQKADGECAERRNQRNGRVAVWKEFATDNDGEKAIDREVVPLHDVADDGGENDSAFRGRDGRLGG